MKNFVAIAMIISLFLGILGGVFAYNKDFSDALFSLGGLGMYVFGFWGSALLLKSRK